MTSPTTQNGGRSFTQATATLGCSINPTQQKSTVCCASRQTSRTTLERRAIGIGPWATWMATQSGYATTLEPSHQPSTCGVKSKPAWRTIQVKPDAPGNWPAECFSWFSDQNQGAVENSDD